MVVVRLSVLVPLLLLLPLPFRSRLPLLLLLLLLLLLPRLVPAPAPPVLPLVNVLVTTRGLVVSTVNPGPIPRSLSPWPKRVP